MDKQVVISIKTILFSFLMLLAGYILYRLGPIFAILLIAFLIVISVEPLIRYLMTKDFMNSPVSRGLAVVSTYLVILLIFIGILTIGIPPIVGQFKKMIFVLIDFLNGLNVNGAGIDKYLTEAVTQISDVSGGVLSATLSVFSSLATLVSLLIISIYLSLDWPNIKDRMFSLFPDNIQDEAKDTLIDIENNIGYWIKGQLVLMLIIGVISFIGLFILGVDYPLALGLIAGLLEVVPMLGPVLSAILASIIGFSISPVKGFGVIVLFTVIQQLENNLLVPKVMQKVSGFSPLVILLALLIGSEFFGVIGALIAVPVTMIGSIIIKKVLLGKKK